MSNGIITNTLPTIISMGVVSRAVDTTMGHQTGHQTRHHGRGRVQKPKSRKPKIHKGSRGGRYIIRKGRRVYI